MRRRSVRIRPPDRAKVALLRAGTVVENEITAEQIRLLFSYLAPILGVARHQGSAGIGKNTRRKKILRKRKTRWNSLRHSSTRLNRVARGEIARAARFSPVFTEETASERE